MGRTFLILRDKQSLVEGDEGKNTRINKQAISLEQTQSNYCSLAGAWNLEAAYRESCYCNADEGRNSL